MKNKQFKIEQLSTQTFPPDKIRSKTIEISVLSCLPVDKFNVLLECFLPYTHLIHPKIYGQWDSDPCQSISSLAYQLLTNLVLKKLSSIFGCPYRISDTNIPLAASLSYSDLATMILVH